MGWVKIMHAQKKYYKAIKKVADRVTVIREGIQGWDEMGAFNSFIHSNWLNSNQLLKYLYYPVDWSLLDVHFCDFS